MTKVEAIVAVLKKREDWLSDGYGHYVSEAYTQLEEGDDPSFGYPNRPLAGHPPDGPGWTNEVLELVAREILVAIREAKDGRSEPR